MAASGLPWLFVLVAWRFGGTSGLPWWVALVKGRLGGGIWVFLVDCLGWAASWWRHLGCLSVSFWWRGVLVAASGLSWWVVMVEGRLGGDIWAALVGCFGGRASSWRHLGCLGCSFWWCGVLVATSGLPLLVVLVEGRLNGRIWVALVGCFGGRASWWRHLGCHGELPWWKGVLVAAFVLSWWVVLVDGRLGGGIWAALVG